MEKENSIETKITNSATVSSQEANKRDVRKEDKPLEDIREDTYKEDRDNGHDKSCKKGVESTSSEHKGQKKQLEAEAGCDDVGRMEDSGPRESKSQGKDLKPKVESDNLGKAGNSEVEKSKAKGKELDIEVKCDHIGKMKESGVEEPRAQGKELESKIERGDLGKVDLSKNSRSKLDECDDLLRMEVSRDSICSAQGKNLNEKIERDDLLKVEKSGRSESKNQEEKLDGKTEKHDLKMTDASDSDSRTQVETEGILEKFVGEKDKGGHSGKGEKSGCAKSKNQEEKSYGKTAKVDLKTTETSDLDSKTPVETEGILENVVGEKDKGGDSGKVKEGGCLESKNQEDKSDGKPEQVDLKTTKASDLDSKTQVETEGILEKVVGEKDKGGHSAKVEESGCTKSKNQEGKLDGKTAQVDLKTTEVSDLGSKTQVETEGILEKVVGEKDKGGDSGKVKESGCLESKNQEDKLDGKTEQVDLKTSKASDLDSKTQVETEGILKKVVGEKDVGDSDKVDESKHSEFKNQEEKSNEKTEQIDLRTTEASVLDSKTQVETEGILEEVIGEKDKEGEPVFDGTEDPGMDANRDLDLQGESSAWPEKAVALKNFVKEKGVGAVAGVLRRFSGKQDETEDVSVDEKKVDSDSGKESEAAEITQKTVEKSAWNPLNFIKMTHDADNKTEPGEMFVGEPQDPVVMKGRIILFTRLNCQDSKDARLFLRHKRLSYVEINIDVYPERKLELEKIAGSSAVPKVFFNEILVGGVTELQSLDESGKLNEKIDCLIAEAPSSEAPLPPFSGEDDVSCSSAVDELALVARKMKSSIVIKDRFYKMRRFTKCFLGSEAVAFLSEDQYLEREEAVEFGRKLASKLFFHHVFDENLFEDGNHLYRFLDDDPAVLECHNIPRGIIDVKPKPLSEIASRLRFLSYAIYEAYTSEDGTHVDYKCIHGSEEFARYLRIVQELQRVELHDIPREEKLAFFINLYNMMAIHAILVLGHPAGPLERRKLFGEFKYVIGGCTYSLSAIQNGILRGNQRPPYNLMKPFGAKDKRSKVALPYPEPTIHFALVCGTRSGPALRCYSPGNIDKELMDAARNFLRDGGLVVDLQAKVASVSKILKWFSVDFGKNEVEVLKHASNYLEPTVSEALLELLVAAQLKVTYQPYDWGMNC